MFPGMRGPEPLPDHVAQQQFWKQINRFLTITSATIVVSLAVRFVERKSFESLIGSI